jgi:hypothetical protein
VILLLNMSPHAISTRVTCLDKRSPHGVATASQQLDRRSCSRCRFGSCLSRCADSVEHHMAQTLAPSGLGNAGHVTTRRREHPAQGALPSPVTPRRKVGRTYYGRSFPTAHTIDARMPCPAVSIVQTPRESGARFARLPEAKLAAVIGGPTS